MSSYRITPLTRLRRKPQRGHYDHATVYAILDAGVVAHVGYRLGERPVVIPTAYWRDGGMLYWHGSSASRMLETVAGGVPVCVTVTHLDGFVLARSGFHHSLNYRSVLAFGTAEKVADPLEKLTALERFVERLWAGRWAELRPVTDQELKATLLLRMPLDEVSAKIRTGAPVDDEADYALPVWAGVLPVHAAMGEPLPDPRLAPGTPLPAYLGNWDMAAPPVEQAQEAVA